VSRGSKYLTLWLITSLVTVLMAMNHIGAAYDGTEWTPVTNDSFYHARRILDAAEGERGFYQFDEMIHAPEGSWVTWPWAYDYFMAKTLQGVKLLSPDADSMGILVRIPMIWILINAGLLLLIAMAIRLPGELCALVMASFAFSPIIQQLHGIGMIDHHYVEYSFVLLTVLSGLRWMEQPDNLRRAALTGLILGIAPAFHNGLFALQIPALATVGLLWLRNIPLPQAALRVLALCLIAGTLAAVLPSGPFQDGQFEFYTLSWFHLYVASCSAVVLLFMGQWSFSPRQLLVLLLTTVVLLIPLYTQIIGGSAFLSRDILLLEAVSEAQSPLQWLVEENGVTKVTGYYSWLILLAPLLILASFFYAFRATGRNVIWFSVFTAFGISLLLLQFRLHYFGSFALMLGGLLIVNKIRIQRNLNRTGTFAVALVLLAAAYVPAAQERLFIRYAFAGDPFYASIRGIYPDLKQRCQENPGIVITDHDSGHQARYHSNCSVIGNNFLMTRQHEDKIRELKGLMALTPEQLLIQAPDVRYVFARARAIYLITDDGERRPTAPEFARSQTSKLFGDLIFRNDLPARFKLVSSLPVEDFRSFDRARLFEILPEDVAGDSGT